MPLIFFHSDLKDCSSYMSVEIVVNNDGNDDDEDLFRRHSRITTNNMGKRTIGNREDD